MVLNVFPQVNKLMASLPASWQWIRKSYKCITVVRGKVAEVSLIYMAVPLSKNKVSITASLTKSFLLCFICELFIRGIVACNNFRKNVVTHSRANVVYSIPEQCSVSLPHENL